MNKFTYQAILRGDRLEWRGEKPPEATRGEIAVDVTILQEDRASVPGAGERMAAALERLASSHAAAGIEDPVAWQRETRKDRQLPGRD